MKFKLLLVILAVCSLRSYAQNVVTNEVLQRVFFIRYGDNAGSSFIVSIDNNDYLITAKHLFPNLKSKSLIDIDVTDNKGWHKLPCRLLTHQNPNIDIAVLDLMTHNQKENLFDLNSAGYFVSQECFFLGFPLGLKMDDKKGDMNHGFPLPFVKRGIVSSMMTDTATGTQIFLDGHNNPGFSGGPVAIINNSQNEKSKHRMKIIGVVTAYVNEDKSIKTPVGDIEMSNENSGIVLCYDIRHVYEIINFNK